jgi:hypothetical protein
MTIIEQRYYGDVNSIAKQMKAISQGLKEVVALLQSSINNSNKENNNGDNDRAGVQ